MDFTPATGDMAGTARRAKKGLLPVAKSIHRPLTLPPPALLRHAGAFLIGRTKQNTP